MQLEGKRVLVAGESHLQKINLVERTSARPVVLWYQTIRLIMGLNGGHSQQRKNNHENELERQ